MDICTAKINYTNLRWILLVNCLLPSISTVQAFYETVFGKLFIAIRNENSLLKINSLLLQAN